jgi:hypothetical protein
MKKLNKKGTDKMISVYWFVILFIVAAAVFYMAVVFYGEPYDIREREAKILINQIADCISQGGEIREGIINEGGTLGLTNGNILSKCHLNFNVEDFKEWKTQEQFYVEINFYEFDEFSSDKLGSKFVDEIIVGNKNLNEYCDKKGENFPVCVKRDFYVLIHGNPCIVKIKSIVRKTEKNV